MLTKKQHQLLLYIHECLETRGVSPSFDEMKEALDLKSKSGIHRLITGLTERGFIRRLPHRARALEVLKLPDDLRHRTAADKASAPKSRENLVEVNFMPRKDLPVGLSFPHDDGDDDELDAADDHNLITLPLYGRIAAGLAIEALSNPDSFIDIPADMIGKGRHFCLEVAGDSMIEAGILDGDTVIIRESETAENGKIVVALIDDNEVTLKRLRRKGGSIALEAANPAYETRIFGPDQVKVQGHLVGLFRRY
ncbi:MAG: repressor LexA [Sneathiella sp.]|jgi:repressor LexA|uniref:transcriptional repressor LexA n=1 Tax=Sneathiella sp. TaxID=1964365 RepID=UPI000C51C1C1|nr:transcriptional repressor LexA [Sneathiella sp.]MAL79690.1 repressor LexA [Sneathiella sp.]